MNGSLAPEGGSSGSIVTVGRFKELFYRKIEPIEEHNLVSPIRWNKIEARKHFNK